MPTVGKNLVIGISGHRGPAMGVRLGGKGDVTETHRLWLTPRNQQRVGCGVVHNGYPGRGGQDLPDLAPQVSRGSLEGEPGYPPDARAQG